MSSTSRHEKPEDARLFIERDMDAPAASPFGQGQAVVFSTRSPFKESPNEDVAALIPFEVDGGVALVADGAGGLRGGDQASSTTVYEICAALEQAHAAGDSVREAILNGIENANREVSTLAIGAATTLALVEIRGNRLRPYHVGDSEILVLGQRGKVKLQTVSHSPMGYAVESGLLDEREAMRHDDRHYVSNVIGLPDMRIELGPSIELSPLDTVVLASDGLFDNLTRGDVIDILRTGTLLESTTKLVACCRTRMKQAGAKPDDLTLITFRLEVEGSTSENASPD